MNQTEKNSNATEKKNASKINSILIDASVLTSEKHCKALLQSKEQFHVSSTLYDLMFRQERYDSVSDPLLNTLNRFVWRPLKYIPREKLDLESRLKPYEYKKEYVEEIYPYYLKSRLPWEVKKIILDEFSFLKEHSSILMSTKKFARHLHRWGIVLIDATNKVYDRKESLFERIRGVRWILGLPIAATGVSRLSDDPTFGTVLAVGGTILVLFDP